MEKVIKRDGRKVRFNKKKIFLAISKAFDSLNQENPELIDEITNEVEQVLDEKFGHTIPKVEDIQDTIEQVLIKHNEAEVAKAFILYRAERTRFRESRTNLMYTLRDITFKDAKDNDVKRENANIDGDTAMGCMLRYGSEAAKEFYLSNVIDPRFAKAHREGDIHIHDMDFYTLTLTCCQIDILELFKNGFSTGHGFLREPQSIRSYASLACIAIQANQNDQHGGQSIPNFDYGMAPGVVKTYKKAIVRNIQIVLGLFVDHICKDEAKALVKEAEDLSKKECRMLDETFNSALKEVIKNKYHLDNSDQYVEKIIEYSYKETRQETFQAMEALIHNLNTMHSRAGAQVPFSSLNYGTDTSNEGRMVIDCLLDATLDGLGDGETPIFPIQIFKLKEGVSYNKEDPNYDLFKKAIKVSGARLFPNFSFLDAPYNKQYYKPGDYKSEVSYMGCRTRVMANVDKTKEITTGRGNLSFTSINLPRLGIKHKNGDLKGFYKELDEEMDLVKDQLLERFNIQCQKKVYNFPFLMGQHVWLDSDKLNWNDSVAEVIKHGTLTIGFIGLAECLKALIGKHHGESDEAQELGLQIVGHMREKTDEYTEKYKLNFSLIATPAEGLSGRFVKIDKVKYGVIPGITDRDYYTNSFHIPVYYKIGIYDKIKREGPYNALTNGGHITYVEVDGDVAKNEQAFEKIIRCMHDNGVGYGSINHPVDRDPVCGYNGIIDEVCPKCGRKEGNVKFERIRRITGYLVGTLDRFNDAKLEEVNDRVKHQTKDNL